MNCHSMSLSVGNQRQAQNKRAAKNIKRREIAFIYPKNIFLNEEWRYVRNTFTMVVL